MYWKYYKMLTASERERKEKEEKDRTHRNQ
jgi:hypothetical protein